MQVAPYSPTPVNAEQFAVVVHQGSPKKNPNPTARAVIAVGEGERFVHLYAEHLKSGANQAINDAADQALLDLRAKKQHYSPLANRRVVCALVTSFTVVSSIVAVGSQYI